MTKKWMTALAAVALFSTNAWAQSMPVYESTGTLEISLGGKPQVFHTTANTVPNQPGRLVHTARWYVAKPMMLGGINLAPAGRQVELRARPTIEPDSSNKAEFQFNFALDEDTHAVLDTSRVTVTYSATGSVSPEYEDAESVLEIESAALSDSGVLTLKGGVAGTLVAASGSSAGNLKPLPYQATFVINAHPK